MFILTSSEEDNTATLLEGEVLDGQYAFRFNGFEAKDFGIGYLIGIGTLALKNRVIVEGHLRSSATLLSRKYDKLLPATFELSGKFGRSRGGLFKGDVRFSEIGRLVQKDKPQILEAVFNFVSAGANHYWLISQYTANINDGGEADEVVNGEMIWTAPFPSRKPHRNHRR